MVIKLKTLSLLFMITPILVLTGCATSRSTIDVSLPASTMSVSDKGKEIFINNISDNRVFEVKPNEPNIPSLDPAEEQNDVIKSRAIARKRSTYGMGLGDILLPQGKTVASLIHDALQQAFKEKGYRVLEKESQISADTTKVDVQIEKFWSWMNPGFWALTLSTEITTDLNFNKNDIKEQKNIVVKVSDTFQTGTEDNWKVVLEKALAAYITEVKKKL